RPVPAKIRPSPSVEHVAIGGPGRERLRSTLWNDKPSLGDVWTHRAEVSGRRPTLWDAVVPEKSKVSYYQHSKNGVIVECWVAVPGLPWLPPCTLPPHHAPFLSCQGHTQWVVPTIRTSRPPESTHPRPLLPPVPVRSSRHFREAQVRNLLGM